MAPRLKEGILEQPIVFISCGQYTEEEISLGKAVEKLVEEMTGVSAYFAENQNSLQALSENIFHSLKRAAGFIAIMHHRGSVKTPNGTHIRGSVWIEQEIAIAAFLTSSGQSFPVIVYQQINDDGVSVEREGVREQLKLDPGAFRNVDDVLQDLKQRIETGKFTPGGPNEPARTAKEEARHNKAKAALDKHCEPALVVPRHLQNVEQFKVGSMYDDATPPEITGAKMREMLRLLRDEGLVAESVIEGPQPAQVYRIAPGMKAVVDGLV